jgi:hypothetical protein
MIVSTILKNLFPSWRFFDFPNHQITIWIKADEVKPWLKLSDVYKKNYFGLFTNPNRILYHWLNTQIEKMAFYDSMNDSDISSAILFLYKTYDKNIENCFYKIEITSLETNAIIFERSGHR